MTIAQIKTYFQTRPEELQAFKAEIKSQKAKYKTGSQGIIDRCQCVVMAAEGNYSNVKELALDCKPHSATFVGKWLKKALVPVDSGAIEHINSLEDDKEKKKAWSDIVLTKMSDAPRSGRPSALSNSLLLLLDCILLLTPDFVACTGLFPDKVGYLVGKQSWTLLMISQVIGLSIGCVHKYIKMLGIDYDHSRANSNSYCWSSDPDYLRKVLLIDLLYRHAEASGICLLCFDEMPCIQALCSEAVLNKEGETRNCSRYERNGYIHVLGLLRPATGKIYHQCTTSKDTEAVTEFFLQHLGSDDFKDKERIVIIWDNLNLHGKVQTAIKQAFPNVEFAYTPTNASWINQVESAFSLISRFAVEPNQHKLNSTQELCAYIDSYVASYNPSAKPFHWDYQIKRDINQRANTLSNLAFVASDFSALKKVPKALDSTDGMDAHYLSVIKGLAAHADVTPMMDEKNREYFNIDALSEQVESVRQSREQAKGTEILHAAPKEMRASLQLDSQPIEVFTEKVEEAYSDPAKALELINELLVTLPHEPYRTPPSFTLDTQINRAHQKVDKAQESLTQAQERQKQHHRNNGAVVEQSQTEIKRLEEKLKSCQKHYDELLAKRSAITQNLLEAHQRLLNRLAEQLKRADFLWKRFFAKFKKSSISLATAATFTA